MTIKTRLIEARKAAKLNQTELAARSGMSQSAISDLERGKSAGTTSLAALAHACGVSALWLETGKGLRDDKSTTNKRPPPESWFSNEAHELLDLYFSLDDEQRRDVMRMLRIGHAPGKLATGGDR